MSRWAYVLLLLPFAAMLSVPTFASGAPVLGGIPFFFWYQFLWVIISGLITAFVYRMTPHD